MSPYTTSLVTVKAVDCDGTPLKGAVISLYPIGGQVNTTAVTANAEGSGKLRFNAGPVDFLGSVTARIDYKTPSGLSESTTASLPIKIGKPADGFWQLTLHLRQSDIGLADSTGVQGDGSVRDATLDVSQREADIVIWYKSQDAFRKQPGVIRTGDVIAEVCNGTFRRHFRESATKTATVGTSGSLDLVDEVGALDPSTCRGIYVSVVGNKLTVVATSVVGETHDNTFDEGFDTWSDLPASAVDTDTPGKDVPFDFSITKTLTPADRRIAPLHVDTVEHKTVDGVDFTIMRDLDGSLSAL